MERPAYGAGMGRRSSTLDGTILGPYLALGAAAHLARTQLVPDPLKPCDAQHLGESLDAVARALAKVAPLYLPDSQNGTLRELAASELEGATVAQGGNRVVLRDGSALCDVCIRRADLRQAIALLRAAGIAALLHPD